MTVRDSGRPLAVVDLGSNTAILLMVEPRLPFKVIREEFRIPRLSEGLRPGGGFSAEAWRRTVVVLREFKSIVADAGGELRVCGGTAPFRMVANVEQVISALQQQSGVQVSVISPNMEAQLSYFSAVWDANAEEHRAVVDIGGGSTEVAVGSAKRIDFAVSVPMGVVRLTEEHLPGQLTPDGTDSVQQLDTLEHILATTWQQNLPEGIYSGEELTAVAGTPVTLALLERGVFHYQPELVDGCVVPMSRLIYWRDHLLQTPLREKIAKYGIPAGRADVIVAGLSILAAVSRRLGCVRIVVRNAGIRFGLALRELMPERVPHLQFYPS